MLLEVIIADVSPARAEALAMSTLAAMSVRITAFIAPSEDETGYMPLRKGLAAVLPVLMF